ncbi:ribulose-phosphate 3-epimerase [Candidatus Woesearchaeota archaeon]|nr:ribulose-phosphate 3-epimerase [Candidatus Woesearchaeota archaeon]
MPKNIEIIPVILAHTKAELKEKLKRVEKIAKTVQIDIEDGSYVPLTTIQAAQFRRVDIKPQLEIHLMVKNPIKYITEYGKLGADRIIFHYESCKDDKEVSRLIKIIKSKKIEAGLAIGPKNPVSKIKKFLNETDFIQVMTIHIGYAGQKFLPKQLTKVKQIRKWNKKIPISVDGGVRPGTARKCVKAGATRLCSGSYLWSAENIKKAFAELKKDAKI